MVITIGVVEHGLYLEKLYKIAIYENQQQGRQNKDSISKLERT